MTASASEVEIFARENQNPGITVSVKIDARSGGKQPRSFMLHTYIGGTGIYNSFGEQFHPDELRIIARLFETMAARCDDINEALTRSK